MNFTENVISIISKIEKGKVKTYKQVSAEAGNPKASRAVGSICRKNTDPKIPCHRVVRSDGTVGDYNGIRNGEKGNTSKTKLLQDEGVLFDTFGKVILK